MDIQVDKDGNEIPHGVLDVAVPRTVGRVVLVTMVVHGYTMLLYVYLTGELLPRTRLKLRMITIGLFLVLSAPEYLLIQLLFILLGTVVDELVQYNRWSSPSLVRFARLTSLRSLFNKEHIAEVKRKSPMHRAGFQAIFIWGCAMALTAYAERFNVSYHASTDCGNLGVDHRNGWVAGVGLLAGTMAVTYRVYMHFQTSGSKEGDNQGFTSPDLEQTDESNHENNGDRSDENNPKNEDNNASSNSSDSSPWSSFSSTSSYLPPTATDLSFSAKLVLAEAYIATLIHQLPLAATHRASLLLPYLPLILLMTAAGLLVTILGGSRASRKAQTLLAALALIIVVWTAAESLLSDATELLYDVPRDLLHAWTIRWKAPDRFERMWRWLV